MNDMTPAAVNVEPLDTAESGLPSRPGRAITLPLGILAAVAAGAALFVAKDLFMPILVAILLALTLSPVVRYLERRRIPPPLTAFVLMALVLGIAVAGVYGLSGSISEWSERLPQASKHMQKHWKALREPVADVLEASKKVEAMADEAAGDVQKVSIQQPAMLASAATDVLSTLTSAAVTLMLTFFLLASGTLFYNKLVRLMPTLADKKRALTIVYAVEQELSAYLLTITLINASLGLAVGSMMWLLGLPNPVLWGVMAAFLNFIPYLGALLGAAVVAMVALVATDQLTTAATVGLGYLAISAIEGNLFTPWLVGRRLALNSVVILVALGIWAWLWGPIGAVIAVPLLAALRVVCSHIEPLGPFGEFLSDERGLRANDTAD